jgi:hypothetical protein
VAKRGRRRRTTSLDGLVEELKRLDRQWLSVADQIRRATDALLSGENPLRWGRNRRPMRAATAGTAKLIRRRARRKMSAAARAKISAAQKARWAKQKREGK